MSAGSTRGDHRPVYHRALWAAVHAGEIHDVSTTKNMPPQMVMDLRCVEEAFALMSQIYDLGPVKRLGCQRHTRHTRSTRLTLTRHGVHKHHSRLPNLKLSELGSGAPSVPPRGHHSTPSPSIRQRGDTVKIKDEIHTA